MGVLIYPPQIKTSLAVMQVVRIVTQIPDHGWGGDVLCSAAELYPRWAGWSCQSGSDLEESGETRQSTETLLEFLRKLYIDTDPSFYPPRVLPSIFQRSGLSAGSDGRRLPPGAVPVARQDTPVL